MKRIQFHSGCRVYWLLKVGEDERLLVNLGVPLWVWTWALLDAIAKASSHD